MPSEPAAHKEFIHDWLLQTPLHPVVGAVARGAAVPNELEQLMEVDMPNDWRRFQQYRRGGDTRSASRQLLELCGLARSVVVCTEAAQGLPSAMANDSTLAVLRQWQFKPADIAPVRRRLNDDFSLLLGVDYQFSAARRVAMPAFKVLVQAGIVQLQMDPDHQRGSTSVSRAIRRRRLTDRLAGAVETARCVFRSLTF